MNDWEGIVNRYDFTVASNLFSYDRLTAVIGLDVEVLDFESMFVDKVSPFINIAAHKDTEQPVGFASIIFLSCMVAIFEEI